jgi:hypothetical protein
LIGGLAAITVALAALTTGASAQTGPATTPFMMGCHPGAMGWGMMGPGMMGRGLGANATGANLNLSANDVKAYLQRWVAAAGNPHVKVGAVTEKDANTITAEIVTTDKDALVQRFSIDRHTGIYSPVE